MQILLVTPTDNNVGFEYNHSGRENLGVEYLLSSLRNAGNTVKSRNENILNVKNSEEDWNKYDLIGFSLPFWEYRDSYVNYINTIADTTNAKIIAGGHASTIGAKYFLGKCPKLLGIVMGEGEETICELVQYLKDGQDIYKIDGFMSRVSFKPRMILEELDELAFPDRDELRLSLTSELVTKEAQVETTRGCTYRCSFCSIPPYYEHAHGKRWRERSVDNICKELTQLFSDFPEIEIVSFTDDNFMGFDSRYHDRAIHIARHINSLRPNVTFEIVCRVDAIKITPFNELKSLGLAGVYLGIESGVQRVLDLFQKRTTVEQNLRAISILSDLGIGSDIGFIAFSPGMTMLEVQQNLDFLKRVIDDYPIFVHPGAIFRCLREYPKDLGEAALKDDSKKNLSSLDGPIRTLYETLDFLWHYKYESEFIHCERLATIQRDNLQLLDRQKAITIEILQLAFSFHKELMKDNNITTGELFSIQGCEVNNLME